MRYFVTLATISILAVPSTAYSVPDPNSWLIGVTGRVEANSFGFAVYDLVPNKPAILAGVQIGDVVLRIDNTDIYQNSDVDVAKVNVQGGSMTLYIRRGSEDLVLTADLNYDVTTKSLRAKNLTSRKVTLKQMPASLQKALQTKPVSKPPVKPKQ